MHPSLAELFDLKHKVALVTGGAMGIGAQIAQRLAEAGASVAVADVDAVGADRTAARIREAGASAQAFACDVGRVDDVRKTVDRVDHAMGTVDILVNNAGIFPVAAALDLDESTWDHVQSVNLRGAFFLAQCVADRMIKSGACGSIVNIASIDGLHPTGRLVHYDASKGGLIMMTRSLALELGPRGIRVNAVAPGAIRTPGADAAMATMAGAENEESIKAQFARRTPLGRMGTPDEIARVVLFLASRAADYVTGATVVVDGGYLLS